MRLWRRLYIGRNPLARPGDRLEARLLVTFLLLALAAIPMAASLGSETYAGRLAEAADEAGTRYQTTAELLADAPVTVPTSEVESADVAATWRLPDGTQHVGEVPAHRGAARGTEVPIWLDERGNLTEPPTTRIGAATDATSVALSVWLGVVMLCALVFLTVRGVLSRFRSTQWARDWARVEREWTRR
ncbi:hypothetical protein ABZ863_03245 [Saccharomonospora sp. NPDC046836]|uniref:Rv1733c family protein n=1 Tax=Saccharomonospora sp. NPDC046836 TaxID=3156921 RepID=UPI0033E49A23